MGIVVFKCQTLDLCLQEARPGPQKCRIVPDCGRLVCLLVLLEGVTCEREGKHLHHTLLGNTPDG